MSTQLWIDLLDALPTLADPTNLSKVPKALPVYVLAGSDDPVNGALKGLHKLVREWSDAGLRDITWKVYEGGRHEMLNETNRAEVLADIVRWVERVAPDEKTVQNVIVRCEVAQAGKLTVRVAYPVENAKWEPTYDVRVASADKSILLGYAAMVRQSTGEDWRGVQLDRLEAEVTDGANPRRAAPAHP